MKNLDRWMNYTEDLVSPESFKRWGFYSLIASCLQRRVFKGELDIDTLFPNLFVVFVADPGTGKDRVIGQVKKMLTHHKKPKGGDDLFNTEFMESPTNILKGAIPLLYPMGADATTFEAVVSSISKSIRSLYFQATPTTKRLYMHSSTTFCLPEIASLFKRHMENLIRFFQEAYDCLPSYIYDTKSGGKEEIKNLCVNLLCGTQPQYLKAAFKDGVLNEGFSSRAIFIVESKTSKRTMKSLVLNDDKRADYEAILAHVKDLSSVVGEVKFTQEAMEFLENWWQDEEGLTINKNPLLKHYYARKNITVMKLAMVGHFIDHKDLKVDLSECLWAIEELSKVEPNMHGAVIPESKNELAGVSEALYTYLFKNGPTSAATLLAEFWEMLPEQDKSLDSVVKYLTKTSKIKVTGGSKYTIV